MVEKDDTQNSSTGAPPKASPPENLLRFFMDSVRLGWVFFTRDLKARHRESFLGVSWTIIPILITTVGFYVATKSQILKPGEGINFPYAAYVFCGMMFWYLFVDTLLNSVSMMKSTRNILGRVSFPVPSVFLAAAFQSILDFLIRLVLFGLIAIVLDCWGNVSWYLFLPLGLLVVIWALTISLIIVPISILFQDVYRFVQIGLEYGVFITPIAFQSPASGLLKSIIQRNPLTYVIPPARDLVLGINNIPIHYFFGGLSLGIILFFLMVAIFNVCVPHLIERIS